MIKEDHWSSEEIIARWRIHPFSLLTLLKQGEIEYEIDGLFRIEGYAVRAPSLISSALVLADLNRIFFKKSDVHAFEDLHPDYKPQGSSYITPHGEIPPYLDNKNQYFSEELSIAIETWLAIYGPGGSLDTKQKHRKQIITHLFKTHPNLFPAKCDLKKYWTYNEKGKREKNLPERLRRIVSI